MGDFNQIGKQRQKVAKLKKISRRFGRVIRDMPCTSVATLQRRFQKINANTCLVCLTSGQRSVLCFFFPPFPLWHNTCVLDEVQ